MTKRKAYYVKDENGKWTQVAELPDHNVEQLSFTFDQEPTGNISEGYSGKIETTITEEGELEALYKLYDPDDIRDRVIDCVDAIRNRDLDGIDHVAHAETTEDILKADEILNEESVAACAKLAELLDVYVEACTNEYLIERNQVMKALAAKDLN